MLGLLRTACRLASRRLPAPVAEHQVKSIPFVPTDWIFRYTPYFCRDRVRFMLRFNQISFGMGLGFFYFYCHTPFAADNYDHFWESPLYRWTKGNLEKSGQLEENLRIKVRHFYPQE
eukprot:TRINITY_DN46930_c0_g1_i1.p1 TRINITY_DN46930_c0_g1~~TRINITY_DN46930_c0_g1_i1.p1  ORF type:complete len:117 (-),score=9.98 TRINITY_DN46930_c0_g1_i1:33-383(-)